MVARWPVRHHQKHIATYFTTHDTDDDMVKIVPILSIFSLTPWQPRLSREPHLHLERCTVFQPFGRDP